MNVYELFGEDASGVVASRKQARDPRYSMSLSPDVRPGEIKRQLKKYSLVEGAENTARLDAVLVDLCEGIIKHQKQDSDRYGLVAAAVVDPNHNVVYGINNLQSNGKRIHAERAALANYKSKHGDIPEGSVIVTTLSPCTEPMADREGISCSELIDTTPIRRVYAGYRDPSQDHLTHDDFDVVVTSNDRLQQLCKGFADCFLEEPVTEDTEVNSVAQEFVKFAADRLKFQQLPHIDFVDHVTGAEHPTFGMYDSNTDTISIGTSDRHVMDIMRTLAHELVHHKQRETKPQDQLDGGTASRDENQANSVAGTLMREFADQHPEYFGDEQLAEDAEESPGTTEHYNGIEIYFEDQGLEIFVQAMAGERELGYVLFAKEGDKLYPQDLEVNERFHRQGIASTMYDYVKSKGYTIRRSPTQTDAGAAFWDKHRPEKNVWENFADGRNPQDKGDSKRYGVPTKASVSTLRKVAKQGGRKGQLAHWMANMKAGRARARKGN